MNFIHGTSIEAEELLHQYYMYFAMSLTFYIRFVRETIDIIVHSFSVVPLNTLALVGLLGLKYSAVPWAPVGFYAGGANSETNLLFMDIYV